MQFDYVAISGFEPEPSEYSDVLFPLHHIAFKTFIPSYLFVHIHAPPLSHLIRSNPRYYPLNVLSLLFATSNERAGEDSNLT